MKTCKIRLASIQDVKEFVETIYKFDFEVDLSSGRYTVDGKSIMGIFSLDLLSPITLTAHTDNADALFAAIDKFIVKE